MDYRPTEPPEPSLASELRASALLFGMAILCTAGAAVVTQVAIRVLA